MLDAASSSISGILLPERRLPLRAYVAGFTLKNGVPINYIEAIGLCEWIESASIPSTHFARAKPRDLRARSALSPPTHGATTISFILSDRQNNDEAIDSGAFWFYRKLVSVPRAPI